MALLRQDAENLAVCVDFDGVLRQYTKGWTYGDPDGNDPVPGAIESLRQLAQLKTVVILTARCRQQVAAWLADHGFECTTDDPERVMGKSRAPGKALLVTNTKPNASVYIDDRAVHFTSWDGAMKQLADRGIIPPASAMTPTEGK
jgi:hypothetical protein